MQGNVFFHTKGLEKEICKNTFKQREFLSLVVNVLALGIYYELTNFKGF